MAARHDLQVQRISKYCQSVEAHGMAPRSLFHAPDDDHVDPAALGAEAAGSSGSSGSSDTSGPSEQNAPAEYVPRHSHVH